MFLETAAAVQIAGDMDTHDERAAISEARELVVRARTGNRLAFEQLMMFFQKPVLCMAMRLLHRHEDAKDAAQEVFLKLYRHLSRIQPESVRSWVYRVTVNVCRDMAKKNANFSPIEPRIEVSAECPRVEAGIQLEQQRRILQNALLELPFKERAALVLRDIEGLSTEDAARILKSSETTVRSQISRGRVKVRQYCERALRRPK